MKPSIFVCCLSVYLLFVFISLSDAQINFPDDDGLAPGLKAFPVAGDAVATGAITTTIVPTLITAPTQSTLVPFPTALPTPIPSSG